MFDVEEWADEPSTNEPVTTVNLPPVASKGKVVGKKSLLKTLQTLGSVPTWDNDRAAENSGDEENVSSAVKATKKKKSKKRKRAINKEDAKDVKQQNVSEVPEKRSRQMTLKEKAHQKSEKSGSDENGKANGDQIEKEGKTEDKLNRKQWKTRMKNKRRCKNKYLEKTKDADVVNAKSIKQQEVTKNTDLPSKKTSKTSKKPNSTNNDLPEMHEIPKNSISEETESESKKMAKKGKTNNAAKEDHKETASKAITLKTSEEALSVDRSSTLREKMVKRLEAARFRFINEQLYTSSSGEAKRMFQQDPEAIGVYHRGYTAQVQHWPSNPLDSIITYICQKSPSLVVADFGCGDCKIARTVKNKVHSFDLAPVCDLATACDMAKVPLQDSSVDIVVFCLSLMGTNLRDFLAEANRVLVMSGVVKIAEVASRFEDVRSFIGAVSSLGFKLVNKDIGNSHFYSFEFIKTGKAPENAKKSGFQLKPCLYKKR